jgi:diguanylate cyclase
MPDLLLGEASDIHRWAARAWSEMEGAGLLPTPQNFHLWFTHVSGANPELSRQIAVILNKQVMTTVTLEALSTNFSYADVDADEIVSRADGIEQAAQTMVDEVASNGKQLQQYGNVLSHWTAELGQNQTFDSLLQAVATLATETARASERNHRLEQRLTASTARITRLKESMAELKREASTDILTGLFNRKALNLRLRRALFEAKAAKNPVSVLMLDVDHFKRVNDEYGHHTGDLVLRLIGRLLTESVKGRDTSARYGGEEFAVVLVGADLEAGMIVANQIRLALEGKDLVKKRSTGKSDKITVSIGVAQLKPNETAASLLERADAAMYQAKRLGRNRVCGSQEMSFEWSQPDRPAARP